MRYQSGPYVSADRRQAKPALDSAMTGTLVELGESLKYAADLFRKVDEHTYNLTRHSHSIVFRAALVGVTSGTHKYAGQQQKWMDKDPSRTRSSSYRMGGIGSMLAVSISTGTGTGYHYDSGDDGELKSACAHSRHD